MTTTTRGLDTGAGRTDLSMGSCPHCNAPRSFTTWEWAATVNIAAGGGRTEVMRFLGCTRCGADENRVLLGRVDEDGGEEG